MFAKKKAVDSPAKEMHKSVSLEKKKARAGWLFVLPFVLGFVFVYLDIIFDSIKYSFNQIDLIVGGGYVLVPVGFDNYREALFNDQTYISALTEGIGQLLIDIPIIVMFSLFIAILLNQKMAGRAAFRAIFFIPVILSTGLIAEIDASNTLTDYMGSSSSIDTGSGTDQVSQIVSSVDVEALFSNMLVGGGIAETVANWVNNIFDIVNRSGVQMLIFLSGLQSISPAIYESCEIEGASAWETFWKITLPMISPMILVNLVYTVIDSFTSESNVVMNYIATVYDQQGSDGQVLSSAMAWLYFLIVILIVGVVAAIARKFIFYQRKD